MNILKQIIGLIGKFISILFTGGRFGSSVSVDRSAEIAKRQDRRRKDFAEYGTHYCKICGTSVPGNKYYCPSCFYTYIKK